MTMSPRAAPFGVFANLNGLKRVPFAHGAQIAVQHFPHGCARSVTTLTYVNTLRVGAA
jgi:hypothetical protein